MQLGQETWPHFPSQVANGEKCQAKLRRKGMRVKLFAAHPHGKHLGKLQCLIIFRRLHNEQMCHLILSWGTVVLPD
jgi:hypothetical protein